MDERIERFFRVPYKRLNAVNQYLYVKKFGFIYQFTKKELLVLVDQADSAASKAKSDFEIEIANSDVAQEFKSDFIKAYLKYYRESREVRDLVESRGKAPADFLALNLSF